MPSVWAGRHKGNVTVSHMLDASNAPPLQLTGLLDMSDADLVQAVGTAVRARANDGLARELRTRRCAAIAHDASSDTSLFVENSV